MKQLVLKTLSIAAAVAAIPAVSSAAPQPQAMNSCVNAFMLSLAKHTVPLTLRESRLINSGASSTAWTNSGKVDLVLTATDARDNHTVGRAICRLDVRGQMIKLEEVPADSQLAND